MIENIRMTEEFKIKFKGHERAARKLLLKAGMSAEELAIMDGAEVEQAINARFQVIDCGEDWIAVPNGKWQEFRALFTWIER